MIVLFFYKKNSNVFVQSIREYFFGEFTKRPIDFVGFINVVQLFISHEKKTNRERKSYLSQTAK